MSNKLPLLLGAATLALSVTAYAKQPVLTDYQVNSDWYTDAVEKMDNKPAYKNAHKAKNVILFVGDGMGVATGGNYRLSARPCFFGGDEAWQL